MESRSFEWLEWAAAANPIRVRSGLGKETATQDAKSKTWCRQNQDQDTRPSLETELNEQIRGVGNL